MRSGLLKSVERNQVLDIKYMAKDGQISKRRIKVLQVGEVLFRAFCHLCGFKRTFTIDNVLALVPIVLKERMVI